MFIGVPGAPCKARIVKIRDAPLLAGYTESTQCDVKNYTTNVKLQKTVEEQKKKERKRNLKKTQQFLFSQHVTFGLAPNHPTCALKTYTEQQCSLYFR